VQSILTSALSSGFSAYGMQTSLLSLPIAFLLGLLNYRGVCEGTIRRGCASPRPAMDEGRYGPLLNGPEHVMTGHAYDKKAMPISKAMSRRRVFASII